jgi:micrococcal nuclease
MNAIGVGEVALAGTRWLVDASAGEDCMGLRLTAIALSVGFLISLSAAPARAAEPAKCLAVIDGDTMNIDRGKGKERVILYGIDCPEVDQPGGAEAKKFTDDRCWKKTLSIEEKGTDRSGRIIAVVMMPDGKSLNEELVRRGLAWWSDKYAPKDATLKGLQATAQMTKTGLWAAPNPVAPWIWRNGQKNVQAKVVGGK